MTQEAAGEVNAARASRLPSEIRQHQAEVEAAKHVVEETSAIDDTRHDNQGEILEGFDVGVSPKVLEEQKSEVVIPPVEPTPYEEVLEGYSVTFNPQVGEAAGSKAEETQSVTPPPPAEKP